MNKLFETLAKPSKLVLIIGSFFYAAWFAVKTASAIDGNFMSVMCNLLILIVGTALLAAVPVLLILGKDDLAKMFFLFLIGYWFISTFQGFFFYAETFVESDNAFHVVTAVFCFLLGLALLGVLVLIVLEYVLKKPGLRFIAFLVYLGLIALALLTGLFLAIISGQNNAFWPNGLDFIVEFMILPVIIMFGYLYFFGTPKQKQ